MANRTRELYLKSIGHGKLLNPTPTTRGSRKSRQHIWSACLGGPCLCKCAWSGSDCWVRAGSGRQCACFAGVRGVQNSTAVPCGSGAHAASRTAAQLMGCASTCTAAQRVFAVRDTSRKRRDRCDAMRCDAMRCDAMRCDAGLSHAAGCP